VKLFKLFRENSKWSRPLDLCLLFFSSAISFNASYINYIFFCLKQYLLTLNYSRLNCVYITRRIKQLMMMNYYDDLDSTSSRHGSGYHTSPADHAQHQHKSSVIYIPSTYAWMSAPLPRDDLHWNSFSRSGYLQFNSLYYLSVKCVINWCPALTPLYPILTAGILLAFLRFVIAALYLPSALFCYNVGNLNLKCPSAHCKRKIW